MDGTLYAADDTRSHFVETAAATIGVAGNKGSDAKLVVKCGTQEHVVTCCGGQRPRVSVSSLAVAWVDEGGTEWAFRCRSQSDFDEVCGALRDMDRLFSIYLLRETLRRTMSLPAPTAESLASVEAMLHPAVPPDGTEAPVCPFLRAGARCHSCPAQCTRVLCCPNRKGAVHQLCFNCLRKLGVNAGAVVEGREAYTCPACAGTCKCRACQATLIRVLSSSSISTAGGGPVATPPVPAAVTPRPRRVREPTLLFGVRMPCNFGEVFVDKAAYRYDPLGRTDMQELAAAARVGPSQSRRCTLCSSVESRAASRHCSLQVHPCVPVNGSHEVVLICDRCLSVVAHRRRAASRIGTLVDSEDFSEELCAVCGRGSRLAPVELTCCSARRCPRSYCTPCLKVMLNELQYKRMEATPDWACPPCALYDKILYRSQSHGAGTDGAVPVRAEKRRPAKCPQAAGSVKNAQAVPARRVASGAMVRGIVRVGAHGSAANAAFPLAPIDASFDQGKYFAEYVLYTGSRRKQEVVLEEDYCFACKDGGELVTCDVQHCKKVYHVDCLGFVVPVSTTVQWVCPRHYCAVCGEMAAVLCPWCPMSFCEAHPAPHAKPVVVGVVRGCTTYLPCPTCEDLCRAAIARGLVSLSAVCDSMLCEDAGNAIATFPSVTNGKKCPRKVSVGPGSGDGVCHVTNGQGVQGVAAAAPPSQMKERPLHSLPPQAESEPRDHGGGAAEAVCGDSGASVAAVVNQSSAAPAKVATAALKAHKNGRVPGMKRRAREGVAAVGQVVAANGDSSSPRKRRRKK